MEVSVGLGKISKGTGMPGSVTLTLLWSVLTTGTGTFLDSKAPGAASRDARTATGVRYPATPARQPHGASGPSSWTVGDSESLPDLLVNPYPTEIQRKWRARIAVQM